MCLGIPARVVEFIDDTRQLARVEVSGVRRTVHVGLLQADGLTIGEWVLVHVGFAISRIDEAEAQRTIEFLTRLGDPYEQDLADLKGSDIE